MPILVRAVACRRLNNNHRPNADHRVRQCTLQALGRDVFSFFPYLPLEDKNQFHNESVRVDCAPGTRVSNETGNCSKTLAFVHGCSMHTMCSMCSIAGE
jgi:hypothetical protein